MRRTPRKTLTTNAPGNGPGNCGVGDGGFLPGNTCAKGGGLGKAQESVGKWVGDNPPNKGHMTEKRLRQAADESLKKAAEADKSGDKESASNHRAAAHGYNRAAEHLSGWDYEKARNVAKVAHEYATGKKKLSPLARNARITHNYHSLVARLNAARVRREELHGRHYLVVPTTIMRPDSVMNGSKGPLFYPRSEVTKHPGMWNGMPLLLNHPREGSTGRTPETVRRYGLGYLYEDRVTRNGSRVVDAWFDVKLVKAHDARLPEGRRMLPRLEAGRPIDVSTGLFTDDRPHTRYSKNALRDFRGRKYEGDVATNYRPDHLAVLPTVKGACGVDDGCGTHVENSGSAGGGHGGSSYFSHCPRDLAGHCAPSGGAPAAGKTGKVAAVNEAAAVAHEAAAAGHRAAALMTATSQSAERLTQAAAKASDKAAPGTAKVKRPDGLYEANPSTSAGKAMKATWDAMQSNKGTSQRGPQAAKAAILSREKYHLEAAAHHEDQAKEHRGVAHNARRRNPSAKLDMSADKACKILKDKSVNGHPLTDAQRGMFGAKCGTRQNESGSTANEGKTMTRKERKARQVKYLTANCACWKGDDKRAALNTLADDVVDGLYRKLKDDEAKDAALNAVRSGLGLEDGAEVTEELVANALNAKQDAAEELTEDDPTYRPKSGKAGKGTQGEKTMKGPMHNKKGGDADGEGEGTVSLKDVLDRLPADERASLNRMFRRDKARKVQVVNKLKAIAKATRNDRKRGRIEEKLANNAATIEDLEELLDLVDEPVKSNAKSGGDLDFLDEDDDVRTNDYRPLGGGGPRRDEPDADELLEAPTENEGAGGDDMDGDAGDFAAYGRNRFVNVTANGHKK